VRKQNVRVLLGCAAALAAMAPAGAASDSFVDYAKSFVAQVTQPVTAWTGPATGPRAAKDKLIVYVSTDQRNGGARGAGQGAAQAAKAVGWQLRIIDGQGTISGQTSAMAQAIALHPDGIILGGVDALQEAPEVADAERHGIVVVGWHAGPTPGPMTSPQVFANITTNPLDVAKAAALYAVATSDGKAGAVIFTDSAYTMAIKKSDTIAAWLKKCAGCKILAVENTPLADVANRMPQLTTSLLERFGPRWTYSLGINDLYFDFIAPSLQSAGIPGSGPPTDSSAGDGSASAFQRIRTNQYQAATVAEPLNLQGWECIDELNRAFNHVSWSGYVPPVHLFTSANIDRDGGAQNLFDPANHYEEIYTKIWTGA
jgi:ribose transport system substrate-binding protein